MLQIAEHPAPLIFSPMTALFLPQAGFLRVWWRLTIPMLSMMTSRTLWGISANAGDISCGPASYSRQETFSITKSVSIILLFGKFIHCKVLAACCQTCLSQANTEQQWTIRLWISCQPINSQAASGKLCYLKAPQITGSKITESTSGPRSLEGNDTLPREWLNTSEQVYQTSWCWAWSRYKQIMHQVKRRRDHVY